MKLNERTKRAAQALGDFLPTLDSELVAAPAAAPPMMRAAVYTGESMVSVEQVPTPAIGPGELLIRVESCGICHTDLKKIEYNLLAPPRIFGHETAGVVAATGISVRGFSAGDRVIVFHHIPCRECFYCRHKLYAQCPVYKRVGVTAGYEPAGGGFSQYVRVMDWIVERGVEKIPDGVSFDRACFVEPVNTCVKGVVQLDPQAEDVVVILGQGPIGLLFTPLVKRSGATMVATDTMPFRRELAVRFGAAAALDPRDPGLQERIMDMTGGRGADSVIVAASAPGIVEQAVKYSRPGQPDLCYSPKPRIRNGSSFPGPISAWVSETFLDLIAPRWIYRSSRRTWSSAGLCRGGSGFAPVSLE